MTTWNHRVLVFKDGEDVWFAVHSVYYEDGIPGYYSSTPCSIGGESKNELLDDIKRKAAAIEKPWLWARDRWPQVYKP